MIAELQALQTALIDLGYQCALSFGRPLAADLTKSNIDAGRVVLFFPTLEVDREPMMWQGSPLVWLSGSITAFAKYDRDAVELSHEVLMALGFRRETGTVGRPPKLPYKTGNVVIVWIACPGGVRCVAQQAGDIWAVEQTVELAYYVSSPP